VPAVLKINLANGTLIQCLNSRTVITQRPLSRGLNCTDTGYTALSFVQPAREVFAMYQQILDPVAHSLAWSALVAALPLLSLFVMLGVLRVTAWAASRV
jgi:hypothetical protein